MLWVLGVLWDEWLGLGWFISLNRRSPLKDGTNIPACFVDSFLQVTPPRIGWFFWGSQGRAPLAEGTLATPPGAYKLKLLMEHLSVYAWESSKTVANANNLATRIPFGSRLKFRKPLSVD